MIVYSQVQGELLNLSTAKTFKSTTMSKETYEELVKDYDAAFGLKKEGNEYFKQNEYQSALKCYSRILLHIGMNAATEVSDMFGVESKENSVDTKSIRAKINDLRLSAFNNIAMTHLKRNDYTKAIENCTSAIKCDPYNFKALLRRGRAYRHIKDAKSAREDLEFLQKYYKYDLQIRNELKLLEMNDFETDNIVINEEEEKAKIKKEKEEAAKAKTSRNGNDNGYFMYVGIAVVVMILAIIAGLYFAYN